MLDPGPGKDLIRRWKNSKEGDGKERFGEMGFGRRVAGEGGGID
jgi:hypothetical protein